MLGAFIVAALAAEEPATPPPQDVDEWGKTDMARFMGRAATHYYLDGRLGPTEPLVFFFPPDPPVLGAEIALASPFATGPVAPAELAAYVNEHFYPLLATRLADGSLTPALQQRLADYQRAKLTLQDSLRSRIAAVRDLDGAVRERQLAEFAAMQTPEIVALEADAEQLRQDLRRTRLFGSTLENDDWLTAAGTLRAAEAPGSAFKPAEADILRAVAFYQDGLSAEQRHLLREAALELALSAASAAEPVLWFAPAGARVRLPADIPAALQAKIDDYLAVKGGLKAELAAAVRDTRLDTRERTEAVQHLARTQRPSIAAAEALAEGLRRQLAALPVASGARPPLELPPELNARIALYRTHKQEALKTLHGFLIPNVRQNESDGARMVTPDGNPLNRTRQAAVKQAIVEFDRKQSELVASLNQEKAAIRAALADYMRTIGQPQDHKSVDDLLRDFESARQQQEVWEKYRDYQIAVLLPGLSPEQRRLLFDSAIVQLRLPLPAGEPLH